ncbi:MULTISPECIES: GntR family transcriptional regulator [Macrococcoides]|uniref:GntR family transcriptional regulator n=2 Tax=Macrococcoides TaxID=3076173 RepID=A0A509GMN3_9STAP|nr:MULTISPECIES: GntR family transcriptional regulator [Macrococcus]QAX90282.1 GntR family transcriptional regulator [Macrococcus canis]QIH77133.1 UTRA domain-containing protein [Macrococcus canis]QNR06753.1 UTRA domain-containing protein [Macrococcus canis]RAI81078.1 GntR family transcriptional regulator [Macrococcus goetzii]
MKSQVQLYLQIAEKIRNNIDNGELQVGDKLPSERKLCELYDVSRITIRQALDLLEDERIIQRKQGIGTYVLPSQYNQILNNLYSFSDEIIKKGDKPSTKMLDIQLVRVNDYIHKRTGLMLNAHVFKLTRLRLANDKPLVLEYSYIPQSLAPDLDKFNFNKVSLYKTLSNEYQIQIDSAHETLEATILTKEEAELLNKKPKHIAMYIQRYAYSKGQIVEYTRSLVVGDEYKYTVELL